MGCGGLARPRGWLEGVAIVRTTRPQSLIYLLNIYENAKLNGGAVAFCKYVFVVGVCLFRWCSALYDVSERT